MKQEFSTSWLSSSQVRRQRKYRFNAPFHTRHTFLSAHLSKDLRVQHGRRSLPLRKGDEVEVMRGTNAGKKAKVNDVDVKKIRVTLENVNRQKRDGTKLNVYFNPSNLKIVALALEDKKRLEILNRKGEKNAPNKSRNK